MGILTTQDSGRAFSTYVALFGLALLISSSMYLSNLNHWAEKNTCVPTVPESGKPTTDILCSNYNTWRTAAIIGIIIGVVDVLVVPFLLCCSCCIVCGCTALLCVCIDCKSTDSNETSENTTQNRATAETPMAIEEATTTPTTNDSPSKFNLTHLPKPVIKIINILGWAVWVFLPFIGTLLITIWLYKFDAIRTSDDKLYGSALTVFVCALLNLMVYYQKFIDSVCQRVCGKISEKEKARRGSAGSNV